MNNNEEDASHEEIKTFFHRRQKTTEQPFPPKTRGPKLFHQALTTQTDALANQFNKQMQNDLRDDSRANTFAVTRMDTEKQNVDRRLMKPRTAQ